MSIEKERTRQINVLNDDEIKKIIANTKEYYELDETARQKRALDSLNHTSTALSDGYGEQEILERVIEGIRAIGFDRVRIYLLSGDGLSLTGLTGFDISDDFVGARWLVSDDRHMQKLIQEPCAHLFDYKEGRPLHPEKDLGKEGVEEWAAAPMLSYGDVIGQVAADNKHSHYLITSRQLDLLTLFAGRAAAAIHRSRRFEALLKVSSTIRSSLDLGEILSVACQAAVEFLGGDHSAMVLFDARQGEATITAEFPTMGACGLTIPLRGVTLEEELLNRLTPIVIDDVNDDANSQFLGPVRELFLKLKIRSALIVPIISRGEIIGSFSLDSISNPLKFSDEKINLCRVFANQLAVAIENSRSYEDAVRSKDHFERLIACSYSGVIAIDNKGIVTAFNEQAEKIQGYLANEVINKMEVSKLYADHTTPRQIGRLLHTNPQGRLVDYPTAVRTKDGRVIPVRISATWLYDGDGKREGSVGFFQDLSSIEKTEKRLTLLLEAGNIIATAQNTEEGLQRLAEMMVLLLGNTFCRILLFDESLQFMLTKAAFPNSNLLGGLTWEPGLNQRTDLTEWDMEILKKGRPIVLSLQDQSLRPRLQVFSEKLKLSRDIQWLLLMPLRIGDKPFGLLSVGEIGGGADNPFTAEKIELASILADKSAILIYRQRQHDIMERRGELLDRLDEALRSIRAEKEEAKLQQEITRFASALFNCAAAALYIHQPWLKKLDWRFSHPQRIKSGFLSQGEILAERIVQSGEVDILDSEPGTLVGVPLKQGGNVEAVLVLADETGRLPHLKSDMDILERFAAHAAIALKNSRLVSQELRVVSRSAILDKINYHISLAPLGEELDKILHLVLTGVTAGYGLGFNRAALLLREEQDRDLAVRMAIGQLTSEQARQAWEFDREKRLSDFGVYLRQLGKESLPRTPLWERLEDWRMLQEKTSEGIFSRALASRRSHKLARHELWLLPEGFRQRFEPETEVAIVPLEARGQMIGLLLADNKFTLSPITDQDMESLATFANTAAVAVDNARILQHGREARASLLKLFKASNALVIEDSHRVLHDIADQTCRVAEADWVCVILVDQKGYAVDLAEIGLGKSISLEQAVREGGIARHALSTGEPRVIEDCKQVCDDINPVFRDEAAALMCLPLSTPGKRIGVVWIGYATQRPLSNFRVEGLQHYANQTAIAYDNARRLKDAERLRQASEEMAGAHSPQEVTEQIVRHARGVLKADSTSFWAYNAGLTSFVEEGSAKDGILERDWKELWKIEPQLDKIADIVRIRGYEFNEDVFKCDKYPPLTDSAKALLERIGVNSFQGVALKVGEESLGVLFTNYKRPRVFSQEEQETAVAFANHAALALKKARLHDQISKAHNSARVVAEVTALGDWRSSLQSIVAGTREALGSHAVTLYVYDNDKQEFDYPPAMIGVSNEAEVKKLGRVTKESVVRKVLEKKGMHIAPDATKEGELLNGPFVRREGVKSALALVLIVGGREVGVMFVNYRTPHLFTEDELTDIKLFAHQAAVAVRNGQMYEELKRTKKTIAARSALAWMGMASSTWLHEIKGHAINIKDLQTWIRRRIPTDVLADVASDLSMIEEMANQIISESVTAPLQSEEGVKSLPINNFLRERFKQLQEPGTRHMWIRTNFDFELDEKATVRVNPDWLSRALDVLVDNADEAMAYLTEQNLTVKTRLAEDGYAKIEIADCGSGVEKDVWDRVLEDQIEHPKGDKRTGMGLLMAQFILQTYGGDILKGSTSSKGTTMVILLPLEKQN